jgi:hypothetical protein
MTRRLAVLLVVCLVWGCGSADDDAPVSDAGPNDAASPTDAFRGDAPDSDVVCDEFTGRCENRRCRRLTYFDGTPEMGLDVPGFMDGMDAEYVFGFQGGVMIQPAVRLPDTITGDEVCVEIEVRHTVDPAFPDESGEIDGFPSATFRTTLQSDGAALLRSERVDDQIGWSAADGVRMQLEVIARGTDWARTSGPMSIRLVDADGFQECDLVAKEARFGCIQHVVSGDYEVGAIEDVPGSECSDRVDITLQITPDVEVPEMCFASTRVLEVERGCIASEGYEVGTTGRIEWRYEAVPDTCGEPRDEIVGFRTQFCCL